MIFQKKMVKHGRLEIWAKNYTSVLKGNNLNEKNKNSHIGIIPQLILQCIYHITYGPF